MKRETEAFMAHEDTPGADRKHRLSTRRPSRLLDGLRAQGLLGKRNRSEVGPIELAAVRPPRCAQQGKEDGARVVAVVSDKIEQAKPESSQTTTIDHARADK
jgi:hypothetical protein